MRSDRWFEHPGAGASPEITFADFAGLLPILIYQQDTSGAVTFANEAWFSATRLPRNPSSFTLEAWTRVVHPADLVRVIEVMSAGIADKAPYAFEYRVKPCDGDETSYRWYVARGTPQTTGGVFQGWIGSIVDIHDSRMREEAERSLRQEATAREREFHALAEAIPVIVWSADASGWIDWYNSGWYQYTGQTEEEAAGWGWQAAHHPDDFARVMQEWPHSVASGKPFEMEFRLRRHDGIYHTFLTRAAPLRDERGEIVRWYGSNVDIQMQKEALDRSQRVAETLQRVFLPDALPHTESVRFDAVYVPAERDALVGGDWFDAVQLPDGKFLISIGDVAGHGLEASVIAGGLRQAILDFAFVSEGPAAILRNANRILRFQHPDVFATALVGLIDEQCSTLSYACAGHPAPLLADKQDARCRDLPGGDLPLGIQDEIELATHLVEISRDAVLAFYTDGITEYERDIDHAETSMKSALARLVGDTKRRSPAAWLKDAVLGEALPTDDIALLLAQFSTVDKEALHSDGSNLRKEWRFHSSDAYTAHGLRQHLLRFIAQFSSDPSALFTAELILGEILANTVEHAPGLVEIRIDWTNEKPVVTVRDAGPGFRQAPSALPPDVLDEDGRGLFLIKSLSEDFSMRPASGFGTEVCVVLPVSRALS